MDDLLKIGFTEKEIDELINKYNKEIVYPLVLNFENTEKIFEALEKMHVEDIKNLIFNRIDLFVMIYEEFVSKINGYPFKNIGKMINNDPSIIEDIFFSV